MKTVIQKIIYFLIPIFTVNVQSLLNNVQAFSNISPSIVIVSLLFYSQKSSTYSLIFCAFSVGLLIDFLSITPLGFYSLIYLVIGLGLGMIRNISNLDNIGPFLLNLTLFYFIREILILFLSSILDYQISIQLNIIFSLILTVLFASVVYFINQLSRKFKSKYFRKEEYNA